MGRRFPDDEDWHDHADLCPNCGKYVVSLYQHENRATHDEPAWWSCDKENEDD